MRFIFHIGAGKTGTTSIQNTLLHGQEVLRMHGVWYLGLMFEHATELRYPWQDALSSELLHGTEPALAAQQLQEVMRATVAAAQAAQVHTLVWSNESFFFRNAFTRAPLQALVADGVDVQFVAYVRRHDAWAQSAHVQWGLKHKTAPGPVPGFQEYVQRRPPRFAPALQSLRRQFPGRLSVRNVDAVGDVVADFLHLCDASEWGLAPQRHNVAPDNVEMLLHALFNNLVNEPVLPGRFAQQVAQHVSFGSAPGAWLARLLPTAQDLAQVRADSVEDRAALNNLLQANKQAPLAEDALAPRTPEVNESQLLFVLAQLVLQQAQRIAKLEAQVRGSKPPQA